jgi:prepilin-type N-terminal cleavage/methylation domain-containing protein
MQVQDSRPALDGARGRLGVSPKANRIPPTDGYPRSGGASRLAQSGFTLMELMIVVAIVGVLASFALESYQGAMVKTRIADGLALLASQKLTIVENITSNRAADACAGVTDISTRISSVERTQCTDDGTVANVHVELVAEAGGVILDMVNNRNSPTLWVCVPDPAFADFEYLPNACRN